MQLFSYVVDHDEGGAPHASGKLCTLVHCKFGGRSRRRNIVEMANEGDWLLGSGGASARSTGRNTIIYFMRIDRKVSFSEYLATDDYRGRIDCVDHGSGNLFALVSQHFYYFGRNAILISALPQSIPRGRLLKWGMGYRRDFPEASLKKLIGWFEKKYEMGILGTPCGQSRLWPLKNERKLASYSPRRSRPAC